MKTNEELQKDVMSEIRWDPLLKDVATEIGVTANDGVITLSGMVNTYAKKIAAERAAQRVMGVKVVALDLVVKVQQARIKTDTEIAQAIKNALTWHTAVNEDMIEIKVEDGWVFLDGKVQWDYEKKAAENAIHDLIGIRGITNRIVINPKTLDGKEIKKQISSAFHRSATIDSASINVDTSVNKVTLRGKVRSWREKKEAEDVAWSLPGVLDVDNQIVVDTEILV